MKEPDYIRSFRAGFGGAWNLASFTWVPNDGQQQQEILIHRTFDSETNAFGMEMIIWDRLVNTYEHIFLDGRAFQLFLGVVGDLLTKNTKWPSSERSDNAVLSARLAVGNDGEPLWYSDRGRWQRDETAYKRWLANSKAEVRGIKGHEQDGGAPQK